MRRPGGRVPGYHKTPNILASLDRPSRYIQMGAESGPLTAVSAALGDVGAGMIDQHKKEEQAAVAAHVARSKLNVDGALAKGAIENEADAETYSRYVANLRSKWLEQLPENQREDAGLYFDTQAQGHYLKIMGRQRDKQNEENKAVLLESYNASMDQAAAMMREGNFQGAELHISATEASRHQLFNSDMVSANEFVDMGSKFSFEMTRHGALGEYDRALGNSLADAESFINGLAQNDKIPMDDRDKLVDELRKSLDATIADQTRANEKIEKAAEKAAKERQEAIYADAVSRLNDDDPTNDLSQTQLDTLLKSRELTPALHTRLSKAINGGGAVKDDPQAVVQLYQAIDSDVDPETIKADALQMYADQVITKSTLDKFRTQADGLNSEEPETQRVKQYRVFVSNSIAMGGLLAVFDDDTSFLKASAIREYNERIAKDEDPADVADDIVARYRLTAPGPSGLPKPRYLKGDRGEIKALEAAKKATAQALRNGEISRQQAIEEARLIEKLLGFIEQKKPDGKTPERDKN